MGRWSWSPALLWRAVASTAAAAPPSPSRHTPVCTYYTIQAVPREYTGPRLAARERAMGRIPAVVLTRGSGGEGGGGGEVGPVSRKVLLTTSEKQICSLIKRVPSFCSTTFALKVRAGPGSSLVLQTGTVLPIKVHKDVETGKILNLVLEWAEKGAELKVDIPVAYKGEDVCPGLQKGGYLHKMRSTLKYLCPAESIPPTIEVDLTNLDIGDKVLVKDVSVDSSLKLLSKNYNIPICKMVTAKPKETGLESISEATNVQDPTEV